MDLDRFRARLASQQPLAMDLPAAWKRYCAEGGRDDDAAFSAWLAAQYPQSFAAPGAHVDSPVETSRVLLARFANAPAGPRAAVDSDATTLLATPVDATGATHGEPVIGNANPFHYELLGTAGVGGMGTVHVARDTELLRRVALKQINREADAIDGARARFLREVQITAQLDHPNIVPVYALELAPGGAPAYTMKYVHGTTFDALLHAAREAFEAGRVPDETHSLAARLEQFLKVCDAMAYAHDKGVIHRDLKPANLMLGRHNEVYVMDWGLCRVLHHQQDIPAEESRLLTSPEGSGSASETHVGDIAGTPKYMSPEQAQGRNDELDARSDQFALGLIAFELATLQAPYAGNTASEVLLEAAAGKRRPVVHAYLGKRVPRELVAIIERATAYSLGDRYASVAELAADLRRYLRGDAVRARPDTRWQRMQRYVGQHRQRVLNGFLAVIALAAIVIGALLWQNQRQFKAERVRQQRLLALSTAVADVGDHVQLRFLQLEGVMENLGNSVAQLLAHGQPTQQHYYLATDFADPQRAPPDLRPSSTHSGKVSLQYPVWVIPARTDRTLAKRQISQLTILRPFIRNLYRRSARMMNSSNVDLYTQAASPIREDNSPLNVILIALTDGVVAHYPGWDGLPAHYDPRTRPWYRFAVGKHGPQWGDAYANVKTDLVELPLTIPLYNGAGQFIGVVSAAFLPNLLVKSTLKLPKLHAVRGLYLLDRSGHVLARTGGQAPLAQVSSDHKIAQVFSQPELVRRIRKAQSGVLEGKFGGKAAVMAYDHVAPFGWSVVAVADPKMLFHANAPAASPAPAASSASLPRTHG